MAIIWQKQHNGVLYQVRSAGQTRRLYSNGVCHTQYHPQRPVTGSVWDLLLLPVFLRPIEKTRKVLLLGLGGGSLVHLLRYYSEVEKIVAVELDAMHIKIGQRFFNLADKNLEIVHADARQFVQQHRGEKYDLVVDDLFSHADGVPQRAVAANSDWFRSLDRLMERNGLLVMNYADADEFKSSAYKTNEAIRNRYKTAIQLSNKYLENRVVAFSRSEIASSRLRDNLNRCHSGKPKFDFHIRSIKP